MDERLLRADRAHDAPARRGLRYPVRCRLDRDRDGALAEQPRVDAAGLFGELRGVEDERARVEPAAGVPAGLELWHNPFFNDIHGRGFHGGLLDGLAAFYE